METTTGWSIKSIEIPGSQGVQKGFGLISNVKNTSTINQLGELLWLKGLRGFSKLQYGTQEKRSDIQVHLYCNFMQFHDISMIDIRREGDTSLRSLQRENRQNSSPEIKRLVSQYHHDLWPTASTSTHQIPPNSLH